MATLAERIANEYPLLAFLANDPEIGPLLREASDPYTGFSANTFRYKVAQTNWWRSRSAAQRQWSVLVNTDPGEANRQRAAYAANLRTTAGRLGVGLDNSQVKFAAEWALMRGIPPDSPELMHSLIQHGRKAGAIGPGAYKTGARDIAEIAEGQWLRGVSAKEQRDWGYWLAMGQKTVEDWNAHLAGEAIHRFPHMADQIRSGSTVADVVGPFVQLVAQELEEDPGYIWSKVKHHDPAFQPLLGVRDPVSKKMRLPTQSDAIRVARSRSTWWKTSNGRQMDAQMSKALLGMFGKVA